MGASMRRGVASGWPLLAALLLAGCASGDRPADSALARGAVPQPPLEGFLQQAQSAAQQGQHERSRRTLREAAMAYPASKEPWLRLTEDYFRNGDYGNAILAAQEVTQRDARNPLAQSVLAVSGLRVSAQALGELRERNNFEVGSRDEAVELTRQMRTHLGEPVLVPVRNEVSPDTGRTATVAPRSKPPAGAAPASRAVPDASAKPAVAAVSAAPAAAIKPVAAGAAGKPTPVRSAAAVAASAPPPAAKAGNPFKVLD